ncbi:Sec-independent protein translocase subunit TatA [Leifsonia poae]|uniref:Sec-independent protein translocase subunit TatA n=1 Tax=Leifsonia poae TaxID=110933 RepID=UPI003D667F77
MFGNLQGWHLLVILAVILLLFGAPKLPGLAKSIGQSMRIFKGEVNEMKKDGEKPADGEPKGVAPSPRRMRRPRPPWLTPPPPQRRPRRLSRRRSLRPWPPVSEARTAKDG